MKDKENEERKEDQVDDLQAVDDQYTKDEQAVRRRHILPNYFIDSLVVGLVFSDTLMEYFTGRREKPSANRVETVAKTKMVRVSAEERQAFVGRVKALLDEGKANDCP